MTAASKSKRRRRAAIGNDAVIPAQAGIRVLAAASKSKRRGRAAIGNDAVIPAPEKSARGQAAAGIQVVATPSVSNRRSLAANRNNAVIPVAPSADRVPSAGRGKSGPGLRGGDGGGNDAGLSAAAAIERRPLESRPVPAAGGTTRAGKDGPRAPILRGFPPIIDERTETLILGSFPSEASLAAGQYYAHPRNQFWRLLGEVLGEPLAELPYEERKVRVLAHRVGIWDVIDACRRPGSLDADISDARPNEFAALHRRAPRLRRVLFNGGAAGRFARRFAAAGFATAVVPSSSPAHAARSYAQKLAAWRAAYRAAG